MQLVKVTENEHHYFKILTTVTVYLFYTLYYDQYFLVTV